MRKILRLASLLLVVNTAVAQIPAGYYNSAAGLTCDPLKTALFNKISANTNAITNAQVLVAFTSTDTRRNDANTKTIIWDIYSDNPTGPEAFEYVSQVNNCGGSIPGEGSCYNREHTFPQAWFGEAPPAVTDLFALYPTDGYSNGIHNNYPYSEVTSPTYVSVNGSKLGTNTFPGFPTSGIAGRAFEVIDEYKGDIARNYFYMVTRYESDMPSWQANSNANDVLNGTTWPSFDDWYIKLLYKWHVQDPVSAKEIARNEAIYAIQNNRNPFIDHPEYVALIWQCTGLLPVKLVDFSAVKTNNTVSLNWIIANEENFKQYEVETSTDGVHFNTLAVIPGKNLSRYSLTDVNLPNATTVFYRLKMVDTDGKYTYSKTAIVRLARNASVITLFPNPVTNELTVSLQQAFRGASRLKITDATGRTVMHKTIGALQNNFRLNVQQFPAGRYFLTLAGSESMLHESFMIVK